MEDVEKLKNEKQELEERLKSMGQVIEMLSAQPAEPEKEKGNVKGYFEDMQKRLRSMDRRLRTPTLPPALLAKIQEAEKVPELERKVGELERKLGEQRMPAPLFGDMNKMTAKQEPAPEQRPAAPPGEGELHMELLRLIAHLEERVAALEARLSAHPEAIEPAHKETKSA